MKQTIMQFFLAPMASRQCSTRQAAVILLVTVLLTLTAQTAWATITGDGSAETPYIISDASDWNTFASNVSNGTESYEGKYVRLADTFDNSANPVTASTMAGTSNHPFKGTFDGNGKTLTVNIDGTEAKCAPFHFINGATIKYLRVEGSVTSTRSNSAGIIGEILGGTVNIENCVSNVTITNNKDATDYSRNNAGLVGRMAGGTVTIENCLFSGDLHQGTSEGDNVGYNAGMLGWAASGTINFENCLFAPSGTTMNHDGNNEGNSHTYMRRSSSVKYTFTNCYYTVTFGITDGQAVGERTNEELAAVLGSGWKVKNDKVVPILDIHNLSNATVNGMQNVYLWKDGSAIDITYSVKAFDGTDLTKDTHYTATINGQAVTSVTAIGNYTLTITAKDGSGYTGSKTINFSVSEYPEGLSVDNDYTKGQDGYFYVNIPGGSGTNTITLPAGLSSLKVYDDGGKNGNYSANLNSTLVLTAPAGYVLQLSGSMMTEATYDFLTVYDNNEASGTKLLDRVSSTSDCTPTAISTVISSGQSMTIYFESTQMGCCAGLDLTVRLLVTTEHSITVNTVTGGSVTSDNTTAKPGEAVTLTVGTPTSGYMLSDVSVAYGSSDNVSINWDGMNDNTITFTMPGGDVTVTPIFTTSLTAASGLFINMPATGNVSYSIPSGVTSFKVYDNGGKNGNYSSNCNGTLTLTAPTNEYVLQVSGSVATENVDNYDYLIVYDGTSASGTELLPQTHSSMDGVKKTITPVVSSGQSVTLYFKTNDMANFSGLDLTVTVGSTTANNTITVNPVTGGSITSIDKTSAKVNETVNLTATPSDDYLLKEIVVSDGSSTYPVTNGNWHTSNTASFKMPITAVSVTPQFTNNLTVDGGLYINMPATGGKTVTIPSGVRSFKVYDDGGENEIYSNNCNGTLTLTAPVGYVLRLSGNVMIDDYTGPYHDYLNVYDNSSASGTILIDKAVSLYESGKATPITTVTSSGQSMTLQFISDNDAYTYAGLDLTVTLVPITYNINYNGVDGATFATANPTTYTIESAAITLNNPSKEGYVFAGWFSDAEFNTPATTTIAKGSTGDKTFWAKWKKSLENGDITIAAIADQEWTGSEIKPTALVVVKDGETVITDQCDISFSNNTNVGTATVNITAKETSTGYAGTKNDVTFKIVPKPVTIDGVSGGPLSFTQDQNGYTAIFDGTSETDLNITATVAVKDVKINREFHSGQASTVMLPFDYICNNSEGGKFYAFVGVAWNDSENKWEATMKEPGNTAVTSLTANTPYLFMPSGTEMTFPNIPNMTDGTVTLKPASEGGNCSGTSGDANWEFHGTYTKKTWTASDSDKDYGFAATSGMATDGTTTITAGQFVRFAPGAWMKPMRCYLSYIGTSAPAPARGVTRAAGDGLPQSITVRLVSRGGETTAIGTLDTQTGELSFDGWYDMNGRKLDGKPTKKGLYINNRHKVVIK